MGMGGSSKLQSIAEGGDYSNQKMRVPQLWHCQGLARKMDQPEHFRACASIRIIVIQFCLRFLSIHPSSHALHFHSTIVNRILSCGKRPASTTMIDRL